MSSIQSFNDFMREHSGQPPAPSRSEPSALDLGAMAGALAAGGTIRVERRADDGAFELVVLSSTSSTPPPAPPPQPDAKEDDHKVVPVPRRGPLPQIRPVRRAGRPAAKMMRAARPPRRGAW